MGKVAQYAEELTAIDHADWAAYLTERSGLPGPRGNIELAQAVADVGSLDDFEALISTDDEYLTFCGVVGLGAVLAAGGQRQLEGQLRHHASDQRWRVREAVAMALQRPGDADLPRLLTLVRDWADDPDPLVQRAAAAAICEPRLLTTPEAAAAAVGVCRLTTASLLRRPAEQRRDADVRTLRQGLGYCWSVAVAADPVPGLAAFAELAATDDPDVAWIVRENRSKKRLAALLD
jgi:hypothetical protein